MEGHSMSGGAMSMPGHGMSAMQEMGGTRGAATIDINDIDYDAYLANDRTLDDPEVVQVERGGTVRLRLINGATATAFWIDLGELTGERSEEHTSELQSLMRISYAVFCLKKKNTKNRYRKTT